MKSSTGYGKLSARCTEALFAVERGISPGRVAVAKRVVGLAVRAVFESKAPCHPLEDVGRVDESFGEACGELFREPSTDD